MVTHFLTAFDMTTGPNGSSRARRHHSQRELLRERRAGVEEPGEKKWDNNEALCLEAPWLGINPLQTIDEAAAPESGTDMT